MYHPIQRILAIFLFIISLPVLGLIWLAIKLDDGGVFFFKQKRVGKDKKPFVIYKIRTMVPGAEKLKEKYRYLNEASGPVFKIRKDPRHTRVGRFLSHTGLDELPQLINIIKGEMVFVGPRPLPLDEANKIPSKYKKRFKVLPGVTSFWVIKGNHKLSFDEWMKLDLEYIEKQGLATDMKVAFQTVFLIFKFTLLQLAGERR